MSFGMMDAATARRFDGFCSAISSRGRGITLSQIGDCAALARELAKDQPDEARVTAFRERLGLEVEEMESPRQKELEP